MGNKESAETILQTIAAEPKTAFVTGGTGLLGNNLVRELISAGFAVKALARSVEKARTQFGNLDVEIVEGDMLDVSSFSAALPGTQVIFHTAAYFRDSYKGGEHWQKLYDANVMGTKALLQAAYDAGVRRFVHASSIAVLNPEPGQMADETALRKEEDADDYYRSKILADKEVLAFLKAHPDMWAAMVLPGWMHGPGDMGPTSAGQLVLDYIKGKIPFNPPGTVSFVDARDVARAMIAAEQRGERGERYLAAGRHMQSSEVLSALAEVTGIPAPTKRVPLAMLYAIAAVSELWARITKRQVMVSWAMVKAIARENDRSHFDHSKSERVLDLMFRPIAETLRDEIQWYGDNDYLPGSKILSARN